MSEKREIPFLGELMGGFECSSHRRADDRLRLDMVRATRHDRFAYQDYERLRAFGVRTARDGLRWHLIETSPGRYDFSSVNDQILASIHSGVEVIWDLFHYGYPDGLDIFSREFVDRFTDFSAAFAKHYARLTGNAPFVIPVNEISFYSWAAGDVGHFYPFAFQRGFELKIQLATAMISAIKAVRSVAPMSRIAAAEPAIYTRERANEPEFAAEAFGFNMAQYQALDMLVGRQEPHLGGSPDMFDIIGVNYYPFNQWFFPNREIIPVGHPYYRPLRSILYEIGERYGLPVFIAETGAEGDARADWFRYVMQEYTAAAAAGLDARGVCIYPILNHPGWMDERHCPNGLWDYADDLGYRPIDYRLAEEIGRWFPVTPAVEADQKPERVEGRSTVVSGWFGADVEAGVPEQAHS